MKTLKVIVTILILQFVSQISFAQYVPKDKRNKSKTDTTQTRKPSQAEVKTGPQEGRKNESGEGRLIDKLSFGGNFGLSFGNITRVDVAPLIGYKVTDKFTTGVGINYHYLRLRDALIFDPFTNTFFQVQDFSQSYYGGRLFGQYFIVPQVFLWGELEALSGRFLETDDLNNNIEVRKWIYSPLVGAGFFQSFGGRGGINAMILYNLNYNSNLSFYNSPWVTRIGFVF